MKKIKNSPEKMREYQELCFKKSAKSLERQCKNLAYKLDKLIPKKIKNREIQPYKISVNFLKGHLNNDDCIRIIKNSLKTFEYIWGYIALEITQKNVLIDCDINISPNFVYPDSVLTILVSQNYILGSGYNYKTFLKQDVNVDSEDLNSKNLNCVICFSNKRTCAYFPCGHAKYCWECTELLFKSALPVCPECRLQIRDVKQIFV